MAISITKPIATLQAETAARVDVLAGKTRLKYITEGAGQDATYTAKLQDAQAYKAAGYPAIATPYPWISAEATATGKTAQQVADLIITTAAAWSAVGAKIEGARQAAKQGITAAATAAQVYAAEQTFNAVMATL